jgi:hypothetical protein
MSDNSQEVDVEPEITLNTVLYARWGLDKGAACQGRGFGIGYEKHLYSTPVEESCSGGGLVMKMTRVR